MCFLAISISLCRVSIQVFCPFCFKLDWLSFYCWVVGVLYIFWLQVFCQMYMYWKHFLPSVSSLHLLMMSFDEQKFIFLMKSNLSIFNRLFIKSSLSLTAKWAESISGKYREHCSHTGTASPLSTSPTRMVHLLQLMNLHGHINDYHPKSIVYIRVYSGYCTFYWFRQMHKDMYHHSFVQNSFTALKILRALPIHPSLPLTPDNHWSVILLFP